MKAYSFKHSHNTLLVFTEDTHDVLARYAEAAFNVADLHGIGKHTREAERYLLGVFVTLAGDFKTVTEINVNDLARDTVKHQVARMTIA